MEMTSANTIDKYTVKETIFQLGLDYRSLRLKFRDGTVISSEHQYYEKEFIRFMLIFFGDYLIYGLPAMQNDVITFVIDSYTDNLMMKAFWNGVVSQDKDYMNIMKGNFSMNKKI